MKSIFLALCISVSSFGAADYALIQDILGTYPILELDNDPRVSGTAVVFATDEGVGFELIAGVMASLPVTALKIQTPKDQTFLTRTGNKVRQEYRTANSGTVVEYQVEDGFLTISHHGCDSTVVSCQTQNIQVTTGKGPESTISTEDFFNSIAGDYEISLSGGHLPKEENKYANAYVESGEALITFPYCHPGTTVCDIGTVFFRLDKTIVYQKNLAPDHDVYTILNKDGSDLYHFSWENDHGQVTWRNYQYALPNNGGVITLEFVATLP